MPDFNAPQFTNSEMLSLEVSLRISLLGQKNVPILVVCGLIFGTFNFAAFYLVLTLDLLFLRDTWEVLLKSAALST